VSQFRRRRFLGTAGALIAALPGLAHAQAPSGSRKIGVVLAASSTTASHLVSALIDALADHGWVDGRNLRVDAGYGDNDTARIRTAVAERLARRPDVLVVGNETVARQAVALTKTTPIVFAVGFDPVAAGLVQSLSRPGRSVTGVSSLSYELLPKRLQLLKEAVPSLTRVAVLYRAAEDSAGRLLEALVEPARALGIVVVPVAVRDGAALEEVFDGLARQKADGVLLVPDALFFQHRTRIAELAVERQLAVAAHTVENAQAGALFSYGPEISANFRLAAALVDRILKGADPATLPVEQASVYELAVNLKTALRIGVTLPHGFVLRATRTVE
jgi:putative ABC transport system substrate-binding protein